MKRRFPPILIMLACLALAQSGCSSVSDQSTPNNPVAASTGVDKQKAQELTNEGARLYRAGNYVEARQHFEQALALDPESKYLPLFVARAVAQQYKALDTPESRAKAEEAVRAYEAVLNSRYANDEAKEAALTAISRFHSQLGEQWWDDWLARRAADVSLSPDARANGYTGLASKKAMCSNDITEVNTRIAGHDVHERDVYERRPPFVYVMPRNPDDLRKASACADEGLRLIAEAFKLTPDSVNAWHVRSGLLFEKAKHAQMQKNTAESERYKAEAKNATAEFVRLQELEERRKAAGSSQGQQSNEFAEASKLVPPPEWEALIEFVTPVPVDEP